jgi:hypothetical protein
MRRVSAAIFVGLLFSISSVGSYGQPSCATQYRNVINVHAKEKNRIDENWAQGIAEANEWKSEESAKLRAGMISNDEFSEWMHFFYVPFKDELRNRYNAEIAQNDRDRDQAILYIRRTCQPRPGPGS